jgi:hypothetical protein
MFEAGKTYSFVTMGHEGETHWSAKLIEVEGPLLKVERAGGAVVLNAHSALFVSARIWSDDEEAAANEGAWGDVLGQD